VSTFFKYVLLDKYKEGLKQVACPCRDCRNFVLLDPSVAL
jgi:hypothetical protein